MNPTSNEEEVLMAPPVPQEPLTTPTPTISATDIVAAVRTSIPTQLPRISRPAGAAPGFEPSPTQVQQNEEVLAGVSLRTSPNSLIISFIERSLDSGISSVMWQLSQSSDGSGQFDLEDVRYLDDRDHEIPIKVEPHIVFQVFRERLLRHFQTTNATVNLNGRWTWALETDTILSAGPAINVNEALQNWYRDNPNTVPGRQVPVAVDNNPSYDDDDDDDDDYDD